MRRVLRDGERAGLTFAIVPQHEVRDILPELRGISDAWLSSKATREKGFSLGRFDDDYIASFPSAVICHAGERVAFANLWSSDTHAEIAVDLMRYAPTAPAGVIDFLFVQLLLWGARERYAWFNLGMAPLSGMDARALAPLWNRIGALVFRHGEHFYNFQGLRRYKNKFDPVWESRYLAAPGVLSLPRILLDVTSLVSGGVTGLVRK